MRWERDMRERERERKLTLNFPVAWRHGRGEARVAQFSVSEQDVPTGFHMSDFSMVRRPIFLQISLSEMTNRPLMYRNQIFLGPNQNIPLISVCNRNPIKCFENKQAWHRPWLALGFVMIWALIWQKNIWIKVIANNLSHTSLYWLALPILIINKNQPATPHTPINIYYSNNTNINFKA